MASLVLVGILIMGPYVVRSINALFQSMDDDVHDSLTEDITQTSGTNFGIPGGCVCSGLQDRTCGEAPCNSRQLTRRNTCLPLGCEVDLIAHGIPVIMVECVYRDTCCEPWAPTGNCGVNAAPPIGHIPGGCPDGEMEYIRRCGDPANTPEIIQYTCQSGCSATGGCPPPPTPACVFNCQDSLGNDLINPVFRASWCPGATTGLSGDTLYSLVCGAGSCTATKCQMYCNVPFAVRGTPPNTYCECLQFPVAAQYDAMTNTCRCQAGYTDVPPISAQMCTLPSPMPGGSLTCNDRYTSGWMPAVQCVTCPGNIISACAGATDTCNGDATDMYTCP